MNFKTNIPRSFIYSLFLFHFSFLIPHFIMSSFIHFPNPVPFPPDSFLLPFPKLIIHNMCISFSIPQRLGIAPILNVFHQHSFPSIVQSWNYSTRNESTFAIVNTKKAIELNLPSNRFWNPPGYRISFCWQGAWPEQGNPRPQRPEKLHSCPNCGTKIPPCPSSIPLNLD